MYAFLIICISFYILFFIVVCSVFFYKRRVNQWFPGYIKRLLKTSIRTRDFFRINRKEINQFKKKNRDVTHLLVMTGNVFDPEVGDVSVEEKDRRLFSWKTRMTDIAALCHDNYGNPPRQTWFVPHHRLSAHSVQKISEMCFEGLGEMEICISEQEKTDSSLDNQLNSLVQMMSDWGACVYYDETSAKKLSFGILCDARASLEPVPAKLQKSADLMSAINAKQCFADFSLPNMNEAESFFFNHLYYYIHMKNNKCTFLDPFVPVFQGSGLSDAFMILPGAIGINWFDWRGIVHPRIDRGVLSSAFLPTRLRTWFQCRTAAAISDRPQWRVLKFFTRGCEPDSEEIMLGKHARELYSRLNQTYNDGVKYCLHYVTGRELYNIIKAAESGCTGDPEQFKDYALPAPVNKSFICDTPYMIEEISNKRISVKILKDTPLTMKINNFPIRSVSGRVSKIDMQYEKTQGLITMIIYGSAHVRIKGVLIHPPITVTGAAIQSLNRLNDAAHAIELNIENIPGKKEVIIKILP